MVNKTLICLTVISLLATGCFRKKSVTEISQLVWSSDPVSTLPEMQMHEEYTITRESIKLVKTSLSPETKMFEGEWSFQPDEKLLNELFELAESKKCAKYKRVEFADVPDGGFTSTLILVSSEGGKCELYFPPGITYKGAEDLLLKLTQVLNTVQAPSVEVN